MSNSITELLANILAAKYGEEVRGSIHDAIELCYTDGKAGVNDLQARQLIETVAAVNEQQQAALEVLEARVEELESGEGGSSQQSTTIDIPTVLVDGGVVENVSVNNNSTKTQHVTFTTEFTETPKVMVAIGKNVGAVSQYGYLSANILYPTITTTGFDFFLANRTGSDRSPGVVWYAYQPTVKTIDLDITIPDAQGMTESQVRAITGPISAAVDAIKTGYDGTVYQTAAEAVRSQINALHVLIGDEPGTAIDASAIGYNDSNVADELTGLNGRLEELESGGTGGLTVDIKAALLACFENVAWANANGQTYYSALEAALYPPANLTSISAVYTQSGTVYGSDSLDDLKADLVVTAHYSDSTTETISNYTLSGTLAVGTSTITVAYGGKTTTFTVTVSEKQIAYLYNWDLTQSLTDSVGSQTITLGCASGKSNATQNSTGLHFDDATQYAYLGKISPAGKTFEFDVANLDFKGLTNKHVRFFSNGNTADSSSYGLGCLCWKTGEGWKSYGWDDDSNTSSTHRKWSANFWSENLTGDSVEVINYFSGKTVKVVYHSDGHTKDLYLDGVLEGTINDIYFNENGTTHLSDEMFIAGLASANVLQGDQCYDMTITGIRIYENEVA